MQQPERWPQDISRYIDIKSPIFKYLVEIEKKHWGSATNQGYQFPKRPETQQDDDSEGSVLSLDGVTKYQLASQNKSRLTQNLRHKTHSDWNLSTRDKGSQSVYRAESKGSPESTRVNLRLAAESITQENSLKPFQISSNRMITGGLQSPPVYKSNIQLFNSSSRQIAPKMLSQSSRINLEPKLLRKPLALTNNETKHQSELRGGRKPILQVGNSSKLRDLGSKREGRIKLVDSELLEFSKSRIDGHTSANLKEGSSWKVYSKRELGNLKDQWRLLQQNSNNQLAYSISGKALLNNNMSAQNTLQRKQFETKDSPELTSKLHHPESNGYAGSMTNSLAKPQNLSSKKLTLSTSYAGFGLKPTVQTSTNQSGSVTNSHSQKLMNTIKLFKPAQVQYGDSFSPRPGPPATGLSWLRANKLNTNNTSLRMMDQSTTDLRRKEVTNAKVLQPSSSALSHSQSNTYLVAGQKLRISSKALDYSGSQLNLKKLSDHPKLKSTMKALAIKDANLLAAAKQRLQGSGDSLSLGQRVEASQQFPTSNTTQSLYSRIRNNMQNGSTPKGTAQAFN